jgi:superfamily II DNA or RNA helicase
MRMMKEFVHKAPSKVRAALKLIEAFDCKTITFAELVETAESIKEHLGDCCVVYHSQVKARVINGRKVAGAKLKRDALEKIKTDPATKVIATAKALDQGFDYPGAELGIIISRTSNPTQRVQRIGRIARKHTFEDGRVKKGVIVNIYLKGTKDYNWLMSCQKGSRGVGIYLVDSVEEIIEAEVETELVGEN